MFASIPNYESFYTENHLNEQGLKCLQLLNEIICDFDQLLSYPAFRSIEKIKTIGSTYMAACFDTMRRTSDCTLEGHEPLGPAQLPDMSCMTGSWPNPGLVLAGTSPCLSLKAYSGPAGMRRDTQQAACRHSSDYLDSVEMNNVVTIVCFATALMENLARINTDAFQEFRLRIGIATGPVIAGVVGATKPTYDIWGDTVNVASRLESNGILGRIQVSERVAQILERHGQFQVDCRGPVFVKGKGHLTTYLVLTPYDSNESGQPLDQKPEAGEPSKEPAGAKEAADGSCGEQQVSSD